MEYMSMEEKSSFMARVGLLEDNARIARLCVTMLQFVGHSVELYEHPRTCLNALILPVIKSDEKTSAHFCSSSVLPIEVLILDLQLPEMTGIEVLQHLLAHPLARSLPLIFCTASNPNEVSQALRLAPYAKVVEKPFKLDVLASAVSLAVNLVHK